MAIRKVVECDNCKKQHDIPEFEPFMLTGPRGWVSVITNNNDPGYSRKGKHYCSKKCLLENESKNPLEELNKMLGDEFNVK